MPELDETVEAIAGATSWDARVALIRRVPEEFGTGRHQAVYAAIAQRVYVPNLAPDFAYVHWREEYELGPLEGAYEAAYERTEGFTRVDVDALTEAIRRDPRTLRIFRLLLGFTTQEFAVSTGVIAERSGLPEVGNGAVKTMEAGGIANEAVARCCAMVVDEAMGGTLFPAPGGDVRSKVAKPDTVGGWDSVRHFAQVGVPLSMFLHQRYYGGAFRQLLDATSTQRGDVLEDAVEEVFRENEIPYIRTGAHNQEEVERRFGITVKPAPDFVVFSGTESLRAILECKGANDGGTARDKAARFRSLRAESMRLGGIPLFAVLSGLGWRRTADALGPVVRDTDGRTFTVPTLSDMLSVQPFPDLIGTVR